MIKRRDKSISEDVADVKKSIGKRDQPVSVEFLSSGSTTSNLALSGKGKDGGWARARVANLVGDGSSGKTLLALELAFWCFKNLRKIKSKIFPKVKKIKLVYCNAEGVMDFPLERMYGKDFVGLVEWFVPKSIESMGRDYIKRMKALKKREFLLYIVDSWDALRSSVDNKRFDESIKTDVDMKGSYNLEKQKYASNFFAYVCSLSETNRKDATLFILSQVRTKIGVTFGKKTYRAGGKALDFYTHQVAWIREVEKLTKAKSGEKRVYGIKSHIKVERSKVAKPFRESEFTILYDYGLDDLGSIIDYLWGKKLIRFNGKKFKTRSLFIKYIERNGLEDALIEKTCQKWKHIESLFEKEVSSRKPRY